MAQASEDRIDADQYTIRPFEPSDRDDFIDLYTIVAAVAGTGRIDGTKITTIAEAVPMIGNEDRTEAFAALLGRVIEDAADSDLLAYNGHAVPEAVLRSAGFHRDTTPPVVATVKITFLSLR